MDGFERRRELKKRNILDAALNLFLTNGVQKVSIAEIASKAAVSQVTIYNYFESKDNLVHEVIIYYVDQVWKDYEQLFNSSLPFYEKVKQIIFNKKEIAAHIHEDFYRYIMKEYAKEKNYIEKLFNEKVLPRLIELFNEGKKQGYVDPSLSNEVILLYIQMFKEFFQRKDVYQVALPLTEELTTLFFYGMYGKRDGKVNEKL